MSFKVTFLFRNTRKFSVSTGAVGIENPSPLILVCILLFSTNFFNSVGREWQWSWVSWSSPLSALAFASIVSLQGALHRGTAPLLHIVWNIWWVTALDFSSGPSRNICPALTKQDGNTHPTHACRPNRSHTCSHTLLLKKTPPCRSFLPPMRPNTKLSGVKWKQ